MSDRKIEVSININGEWKKLNCIDYVGTVNNNGIVSIEGLTGDTVTPDNEQTKAFMEEHSQCFERHSSNFLSPEAIKTVIQAMNVFNSNAKETGMFIHEHVEKLLKERKDYKVAIMSGRQFGKSESHRRLLQILEREVGNPTPPDQNSAFSFRPRRCDCLKCRMGKSHQCMTFSPKKRRGK